MMHPRFGVLLLPCGLAWAAEPLSTLTIYAVDPQGSEVGPKAATFMIARNDGNFAKSISVPLVLAGTAKVNEDYASPGTAIMFGPNIPIVQLTVMPVKDMLAEGSETVTLTLVPKPGAYLIGDRKSATMSIADAPDGSAAPKGAIANGAVRKLQAPADRTGMLSIEILFDGTGTWSHPKNGAYTKMKFHRQLAYTMPLRGTYLPGTRQLVAEPADTRALAGTSCGRGGASILDEASGMEVGDPGQPPLVPFTQTIRGGGGYPSGDKTVPERNLCLTRVTFDAGRQLLTLLVAGSDAHVRVISTRNGHKQPAYNLRLQGDAADARSQFEFDVPIPIDALKAEGTKNLGKVSTVRGPDDMAHPLSATVKWRVEMQ
ncbi:MAG: hypothetical protein ABIT36_03370 [Steroidobacteraceae bacterium]